MKKPANAGIFAVEGGLEPPRRS